MEDKELVIRQIVLLEEIGKRVNAIEGKIESMNNDKIQGIDKGLAITQEKVSRMEKIVYGALAVVLANLIGLIFLWMQKK